jgi:hypothetical protein
MSCRGRGRGFIEKSKEVYIGLTSGSIIGKYESGYINFSDCISFIGSERLNLNIQVIILLRNVLV